VNSDSRIARKFRAYASTLDGFQDLDVLLADVPEGRRADFLFKGGQVIAEMKDINTEAQDAWAAYTQEGLRLAQKYDFDPRSGVPLDRFSCEERELFQQLISKYARRFERFLSEANRQVESTKNLLGLESAGGLLVLINDRAGGTLFHDLPALLIRQFENGAAKGALFTH